MSAPDTTDHTAMIASEDEGMSIPGPWDHDTAVSCIRLAKEDFERECLENDDIRLRSVLVSNYVHTLRVGSVRGKIKTSDVMKEVIALEARKEPESWEAMVIIEMIDMMNVPQGQMSVDMVMVEAEKKVKRTIGDHPRKETRGRNRSTNELRNGFVTDSIEFLTDPAGVARMKLNAARNAVAEAMYPKEKALERIRSIQRTTKRLREDHQKQWDMVWRELRSKYNKSLLASAWKRQ